MRHGAGVTKPSHAHHGNQKGPMLVWLSLEVGPQRFGGPLGEAR